MEQGLDWKCGGWCCWDYSWSDRPWGLFINKMVLFSTTLARGGLHRKMSMGTKCLMKGQVFEGSQGVLSQ
jgi:hypothetical protein